MPKSLTATKVEHENLRFTLAEDGMTVTAVMAHVRVEYGDVAVRREHDIWPLLSATKQAALQGFHNQLQAFLHDEYLA